MQTPAPVPQFQRSSVRQNGACAGQSALLAHGKVQWKVVPLLKQRLPSVEVWQEQGPSTLQSSSVAH